MTDQISLGEIQVDIVKKNIKNIHLSVYPPDGAVRIAAPLRMDNDTIRVFALSKLTWIKQQQRKLREQERETPREFLERESHYLWGKRYLLEIREKEAAPSITIGHHDLVLQIRPQTTPEKCEEIMDAWYRAILKKAAVPIIERWEPILGVTVQRFFVQRMKTRWGSCAAPSGNIRLNTELAKKPPICLEYIIVHEMVHLLEPTHNKHFIALMNRYMPNWKQHQDELNRLPLRYETWTY